MGVYKYHKIIVREVVNMSVKVYSTPTCPWCAIAKKYLSSKNISFEDLDVSRNREAAADMIRKSGQRGVPVLDINGNIIVGFDQQKIDKLLSA
jgi:glutaredoxin-like YruB-family protein